MKHTIKKPPLSIRAYAKTTGKHQSGVRRKLRRAGVTGPIDAATADQRIIDATPARYKHTAASGKGLSYNAWEKRLKAAKARQEELKLQEIEGSLVSRSAVSKAMFESGRRVRDGVLNVPARVIGVMAAMGSDQQKMFAYLTKELQACLEGLAK